MVQDIIRVVIFNASFVVIARELFLSILDLKKWIIIHRSLLQPCSYTPAGILAQCLKINKIIRVKRSRKDTFHNELDYQLSSRTISPELFEANRIIATKDQRIRELEAELDNLKECPVDNITMLLLSHSLAMEIYNAIRNGMSSEVIIQFKLEHNGEEITAVYPVDKLWKHISYLFLQ
jgi:hypothetical protein